MSRNRNVLPVGVVVLLGVLPPLVHGCATGDTASPSDIGATSAGQGGQVATGTGGDETGATTTTTAVTAGATTTTTVATTTTTGGGTTTFGCPGVLPSSADITDFANLDTSMEDPGWWGGAPNNMSFWGGIYTYPSAVAAAVNNDALNVTGTVNDYAGFGLWFGNCANAGAYSGVQFTISGLLDGMDGGAIRVLFLTNANYPVDAVNMKGACVYTSEATKYEECVHASVTTAIPAGGGTVTVMFANATGGTPQPTVNAAQLMGIEWAFDWSQAATPYPVDVVVDDVVFVP